MHTHWNVSTHTETHTCTHKHTQYTPIYKHTHTRSSCPQSLCSENSGKHIRAFEYTCKANTFTQRYTHSPIQEHLCTLTHICTHVGRLQALPWRCAPQYLQPTPACSQPHAWLSWGPGRGREPLLVMGWGFSPHHPSPAAGAWARRKTNNLAVFK